MVGLLLIAGLIFIYLPLIQNGQLLNFDDFDLVNPLKKIYSIQDYSVLIREGQILDIQPIRDLSLWIDQWVNHSLQPSFSFFHFTNVLIWVIVSNLFYKLLITLRISRKISVFFTLLYSFDPIFVNSVAWISARKYLLSTAFILSSSVILISTTLVARNQIQNSISRKNLLWMIIFYFLSCFSHPINLFWPIFAVIYLRMYCKEFLQTKDFRIFIIALSLIGLGCGLLNHFYYYKGSYLFNSNGLNKYIPENFNTLDFKLLALGRYFFQTLFPAWPSIWDHYPGSPQGIIGLVLLPIFFWLLLRNKVNQTLLWMSYFFLFLSPVLIHLTNIFASDNYLIHASIGPFILLALTFQKFYPLSRPIYRYAMNLTGLVVLSLFVLKSHLHSKAWLSDASLWKTAYFIEETPKNTREYGKILLKESKFKDALPVALRARYWNPNHPDTAILVCKSIYSQADVSTQEKIKMIRENGIDSAWCSYYLASLLASQNEFSLAHSEMQKHLKDPSQSIKEFNNDLEIISAELVFFCKKSSHSKCFDMITPLSNHSKLKNWDEGLFQKRLSQLGISRNLQ